MSGQRIARTLPGETGLWVFIFTELALFSLYFTLAAWDKASAPELFRHGKSEFGLTLGMINTLILLTGSWAVGMGTRVVAEPPRAARYVCLAALTGVIFLLLKVIEWHHQLQAGHSITENVYYTWYFFLTGFHALHVLGAVIFLGVVARRLRRAQPSSPALVESAGCYWHLVDLLWIGIFVVLYLL
jgi:nitric oxide reductase NorE protein